MRVAPCLLLALLLVATPGASATPVTHSCEIAPHDSLASVGTCSVNAYVSHTLLITITVAQGSTGIVHVDAVNNVQLGDRIEFDCFLATVTAPCTRLIETGGFFVGTWTVTARMVNANPEWIVFQDAWGRMDVTSE